MSLSKLTNLKLVSVIDTDNSTWQKLVPELGYSVKILSFTSAEEALPFVLRIFQMLYYLNITYLE